MNEVYKNSFLVALATLFFVINDSIIKYLTIADVAFYHFIFYGTFPFLLVPFMIFLTGNLKNKLKSKNYIIPLVRGLIFVPLPFIAFTALKNITLPEFTTLNMATPIFATLLSFFFLKEKLNGFQIVSLLFGLTGVVLVVQPGFANFNSYFIIVLIGSFLLTLTTLIVNKYSTTISTEGYFIYGGIPIHLICLVCFIFDPILLEIIPLILIVCASIMVDSAIFLIVYVFQRSQKFYSSISCLIYLQILWSVLIGHFIFNEYLNPFALAGATFISLSGFLSILAQKKQLRK